MKAIDNAYAVIIAGGEGRRLWPLSTPERPKQFVSVFSGKPLIRHAVDRLEGLIPPERILVVTANRFIKLTRKALPHVPPENIVGEPCMRNTAGAVAIACALVKRRGGDDAVGCIMPADHLISPEPEFRRTLADAAAVAAKSDDIVVLGIKPDRPVTEYGYIECAGPAKSKTVTEFEHVSRFVEKPNVARARRYLASGRYLWNAGMFIWRVKTLENAFAAAAPDIGGIISPLCGSANFTVTLKRLYPALRSISFDYAVMEKTSGILVALGRFDWDDVGSWYSFARHFPKDENGNTVIGENVIVAGLKNVIAVRTPEISIVMTEAAARKPLPVNR